MDFFFITNLASFFLSFLIISYQVMVQEIQKNEKTKILQEQI